MMVVLGLMVGRASALMITLDVGLSDSHALGDAAFTGNAAGGADTRDITLINNVLSLDPTTIPTAGAFSDGRVYQRTTLHTELKGDTVATTDGVHTATPDGYSGFTVDSLLINLGSSYKYLVACYDGENSGSQVWYIGDIAAGTDIYIPRYAHLTGYATGQDATDGVLPLENGYADGSKKFQMTGWGVYMPVTTPDGGMTVALLGIAMGALAFIARKIR